MSKKCFAKFSATYFFAPEFTEDVDVKFCFDFMKKTLKSKTMKGKNHSSAILLLGLVYPSILVVVSLHCSSKNSYEPKIRIAFFLKEEQKQNEF